MCNLTYVASKDEPLSFPGSFPTDGSRIMADILIVYHKLSFIHALYNSYLVYPIATVFAENNSYQILSFTSVLVISSLCNTKVTACLSFWSTLNTYSRVLPFQFVNIDIYPSFSPWPSKRVSSDTFSLKQRVCPFEIL